MTIKTRILSTILAATLTIGSLTSAASASNYSASTALMTSVSTNTAYLGLRTYNDVPTLSINSKSYINFTYGKNNFSSNYIWLYDFSNEMYTGVGNRQTTYSYNEMYIGIHANVKNNKLNYAVYNHAKQKVTVNKMTLTSDRDKIVLKTKAANEYSELDTSKLANGLYKLEAEISLKNDKINNKPFMYFYVNNGKTYLCAYTVMTEKRIKTEIIERRTLNERLIKEAGVTPENSDSIEQLCFPWHPEVGRNDVSNWAALSETIVKEEWSDGLKVFAFHEWMTKNLAYDYYKANVIDMQRAHYFKDYSGKHDMYDTRVGVCFDFANVLAIMCRHHGIPAVTIDTDTHTWNLVYLNGRWIEIDLTADVCRYVNGKDYTNVQNANSIYCYRGFNTNKVNYSTATKVNQWLWTYEKAK